MRALCLTPCCIFLVVRLIILEVVNPAVSNSEGDWLNSLLVRCTLAELVTFAIENFLIMLGRSLADSSVRKFSVSQILRQGCLRHIVRWSVKEHPTGKLALIDSPRQKHVAVRHLVCQCRNIFMDPLGHVPYP